ncbi:MAG: hypothetical protein J1D88_08200 [Treponema sp.]|nr:hypothetical protein [Treponema sp.]
MAGDFSFSIEQKCGVISSGKNGWNLELNFVSWGGRPAKYDIRSWSSEHDEMSKGVTLTKDELISLRTILNSMQL